MNQVGCQDGDAIRRIREERAYISERAQRGHWSIKAVARRVGITPQSLSNIELGNKPASLAVLIKISRDLGVPVDRVIKADEEVPSEPEDAAAAQAA
jgi:transcriptional regulator with XRE-family HTH domain